MIDVQASSCKILHRIVKTLLKQHCSWYHSSSFLRQQYHPTGCVVMQNAPAADRNKDAILDVLCKYLPGDFKGNIVEIASGTGQHVAHFAKAFPKATWQPTDIDPTPLKSIAAYKEHHNLPNVRDPLEVDITCPVTSWPGGDFSKGSRDVMLNCNMIHISPWQTSLGLFKAAEYLLKQDGLLFLYGPFAMDGVLIPESNVNFDKSLRSRDSTWGIRDIQDLKTLASDNGIQLFEMVDMPANNKTLIWKKL